MGRWRNWEDAVVFETTCPAGITGSSPVRPTTILPQEGGSIEEVPCAWPGQHPRQRSAAEMPRPH